jgi:succinate dehydrogenase flavin-adding protein (antitoxin of CptAB toxin-antitoxin module)
MLELDLLLTGFLETRYLDLDDKQKRAFTRLLGYQDQTLHDWLMGQAVAADRELRKLVPRIRDAARR